MDERQMSFFEEGGMTAPEVEVDAESGNEVPPGSLPEEVRDDVDAKLSSGEYVVSADVLRYYGMKFFEDLRKQAKEELGEMDSEGRIGGEPEMEEEGDDLSPEEMAMLQEVMSQGEPQFNQGGMVLRNPELGYAEGGTVEKFNPDQWRDVGSSYFGNQSGQQGISVGSYYKTYIGPNGETQLILFVDGKPTTPIPEGFKPREEAVDKEKENQSEEEKAEVIDEDWNDRRKEEQEEAQSWVETNKDALMEDPVAFGMDAVKGGFEDKLSGQAGRLGMGLAGLPGAIGGTVIGGAIQANNLSDARAAQIIAEAQGLDTTELDAAIEEYKGNLSRAGKLIDNVGWATGKQKASKYEELVGGLLGTPSQTEAVFRTTRTGSSGSTSTSQAAERARELAKGGGEDNPQTRTREAKNTEGTVTTVGGTGEGNAGVSVRSGSAAPISASPSSRPQARPNRAEPADAQGRTSDEEGFGFKKGGLVKRRKKKNTTKT